MARGVTVEQAEHHLLGVVSDPDPIHAPYEGRLSIPYVTPTGVVAIRFRCLADHDCKAEKCKKYLQAPGEKDYLYNVRALRERHPAVAVCEGEMDTLFLDTHVLPAIGVPGATKWRPHWSRMLEGYERVFVVGDGDDAGRAFTENRLEDLPNATPVVMPPGMDVNDYFLAHGADGLASFIFGRRE